MKRCKMCHQLYQARTTATVCSPHCADVRNKIRLAKRRTNRIFLVDLWNEYLDVLRETRQKEHEDAMQRYPHLVRPMIDLHNIK